MSSNGMKLPLPTQAAVTKYPRMHGLHTGNLLLTVLEAASLRSRSWHGLCLARCPSVLTWGTPREFWSSPLIRTLISSCGPTLMSFSQPNYFPKAPPLNITMGGRCSTCEFWGTHSVGNYLLKQCVDIIEDDIHPLTFYVRWLWTLWSSQSPLGRKFKVLRKRRTGRLRSDVNHKKCL